MPAKDTHTSAQSQFPKPNLRHEGEEDTWSPGERPIRGGVAPSECMPSSIFPNHFQEHWLDDNCQGINKLNAVTKSNRVIVSNCISLRDTTAGLFWPHGHAKISQSKSDLRVLLERGPEEKF